MKINRTNFLSLLIFFLIIFTNCSKQQEKSPIKKSLDKKMPLAQETIQKTSLPETMGLPSITLPQEKTILSSRGPKKQITTAPKKNSDEAMIGAVAAKKPFDQTSKKFNIISHKRIFTKKSKKQIQASKKKSKLKKKNPTKELDFEVENTTGKTIYVTCFAYLRRHINSRWRWSKTPVLQICNKESGRVDLVTINDESDRKNIFGVLGVFDTKEEASDAVYELTDDTKMLDLDQLIKLEGKKLS